MAYMTWIVRLSQDFTGLAWVRYDAAFRRQAALTGNWEMVTDQRHTLQYMLYRYGKVDISL
jgi:hypothetical protein